MNKESVLYTIGFSFIVTFLFVLPLTIANEGTKPMVAANQELARQKAVLGAMGIAFKTDKEVGALYAGVKSVERGGAKLYSLDKATGPVYAAEFSGPGLWGVIYGVLAVDGKVSQIEGISILSHNETPGLGGRIDEAWYKDQFRGLKTRNAAISLSSTEGGIKASREGGVIDGISGASRTSQFMVAMLNKRLAEFKKILGVQ
jgi:Na+-transporting NADH:ubiquinone oxidoreductase subunit C